MAASPLGAVSSGLWIPNSWVLQCNYFIWNRLHCGCQRVGSGGERESEEEGVGVDMGKSRIQNKTRLRADSTINLEKHLENPR